MLAGWSIWTLHSLEPGRAAGLREVLKPTTPGRLSGVPCVLPNITVSGSSCAWVIRSPVHGPCAGDARLRGAVPRRR